MKRYEHLFQEKMDKMIILQVAFLLSCMQCVLSELAVLRPATTIYIPSGPFGLVNPPGIRVDPNNAGPNVKYGIAPQLLPSDYPVLAGNNVMKRNYQQDKGKFPILINRNLISFANYPAPMSGLPMTRSNPFRIPSYGIQIQKFPLPLIPNFSISQLNLPTYIPYPVLVQQKQMGSNEAGVNEENPSEPDNVEESDGDHQEMPAEEDYTETSEDTVIMNSPMHATTAADKRKDPAIDQTKGIVGDIISFIPFLPIEINVPDVINGIGNGIGWIFNGIGGWIPFFNRPSSPSSRFSFTRGPDGAPLIVPLNSDDFEAVIGNDMFLY